MGGLWLIKRACKKCSFLEHQEYAQKALEWQCGMGDGRVHTPYGLGENKRDIEGNAIHGNLSKWVHIMRQPSMLSVNAYVMVDNKGFSFFCFWRAWWKVPTLENLTTMITNFINIYGDFDDKNHESKYCFFYWWQGSGVPHCLQQLHSAIATSYLLVHDGHVLHGPLHELSCANVAKALCWLGRLRLCCRACTLISPTPQSIMWNINGWQ